MLNECEAAETKLSENFMEKEPAEAMLLEPDWDKLTLADDFLFGYTMQNLDLCKDFLGNR